MEVVFILIIAYMLPIDFNFVFVFFLGGEGVFSQPWSGHTFICIAVLKFVVYKSSL